MTGVILQAPHVTEIQAYLKKGHYTPPINAYDKKRLNFSAPK
jgi:hypothetical protein